MIGASINNHLPLDQPARRGQKIFLRRLMPFAALLRVYVVRPKAEGEAVVFATTGAPPQDSNAANNSATLSVPVTDGCSDEVTDQVGNLIVPLNKNDKKVHDQLIFVRNDSGRALHTRVHFVFENLPAGVGLTTDTTRRTRCFLPGSVYTYNVARGAVWQPGEIITLRVGFSNPNRVPVNYNLRLTVGPDWP